jgi:excisionase family DNA binding protein
VTLPLAAAAERLRRGRPGRPRKPTAPGPATIVEPARRLLDLEAAAAYLSCSTWTIRDLISSGTLRRVRITLPHGVEVRRLLVDRADLDTLIERSKA